MDVTPATAGKDWDYVGLFDGCIVGDSGCRATLIQADRNRCSVCVTSIIRVIAVANSTKNKSDITCATLGNFFRHGRVANEVGREFHSSRRMDFNRSQHRHHLRMSPHVEAPAHPSLPPHVPRIKQGPVGPSVEGFPSAGLPPQHQHMGIVGWHDHQFRQNLSYRRNAEEIPIQARYERRRTNAWVASQTSTSKHPTPNRGGCFSARGRGVNIII